MEWKNYGDVNPIEHGGIFIKPDTDEGCEGCYNVVTVDFLEYDEEPHWVISDMYVDLEDDWYEWDGVYSFSDITDDSEDVDKVIALIQYYPHFEFGTSVDVQEYDEVIQELAKYQIEVE